MIHAALLRTVNASPSTPIPQPRRFPWLRLVAALVLSLVVSVVVARALGPLSALLDAMQRVRAGWLAGAGVTAAALILLAALRMRWSLLLRDDRVTYNRCIIAVLAASPVAVLLPARAGDFFRAAAVLDRVPAQRAVGAVVAEKVVDGAALFTAALFGALLSELWGVAIVCVVVLMALAVPVWSHLGASTLRRLPFGAWLGERATPLLVATRLLSKRPRLLGLLVLSSLAGLTISCLHLAILLRAVSAHIPLTVVARCLPLSMIAGGLPLTISGLGTRDAVFAALLDPQYRSPSVLVATLIYGLTQWVFAVAGFPLFLRQGWSLTQGLGGPGTRSPDAPARTPR